MFNPQTKMFEVQGYGYAVFMKKLAEALATGKYTMTGGKFPQPFGMSFRASLPLVGEANEKEISEKATEVPTQPVPTAEDTSETIHDDKVVPDWDKLNALVKAGDKDGIEDYCKPFGVDLNKRLSPKNMLKEFKDFVGA